jgi:hypothetical protein
MQPEIETIGTALESKGFITAAEAFDQNTDVIVALFSGWGSKWFCRK